MYKLYSIPGSCSTGITVLLKYLKQDVQVIKREDVENYQSIVPTNQVPALDDNGLLITEGAAIVLYLLEKHQDSMLPSDIKEKAEFLQWLMFDYSTLHPAYSKVMIANRATKSLGEAERKGVLQTIADKLSATWEILDNRLADRKYIVGDKPTIVDYLAVIYTSWGGYMPDCVDIKIGSNIKRLVAEITQLPEFISAYEAEDIPTEQFKAAFGL